MSVAVASGMASATVLLAICVAVAAVSPAPLLEEAGPPGAVRTVVVPGPGVAGAVLWPSSADH